MCCIHTAGNIAANWSNIAAFCIWGRSTELYEGFRNFLIALDRNRVFGVFSILKISILQVRVPAWITDPPVSQLNVVYSERARAQLAEIASSPTESGDESVETLIAAISGVLREDPRSVYLRDKWGNQFYTFLIRELHVSCKFNDASHEVSVFQVCNYKLFDK